LTQYGRVGLRRYKTGDQTGFRKSQSGFRRSLPDLTKLSRYGLFKGHEGFF
jgi:hypothetical protein